jgi:glutathione peroxidase
MKYVLLIVLALVLGAVLWKVNRLAGGTKVKSPSTEPLNGSEKSVLDLSVLDIDGGAMELSQYKGKVVLLVNVASRCGFTGQYAGLESLYQKYREQGLVIIGLPSNDFGGQEPGSESEIKQFCSTSYGVSFPMTSKVSVTKTPKHPVYAFLTEQSGAFAGEVKWNFSKYLVDRQGRVIAFFPSMTAPDSENMIAAIEAALAAK